MSEITIDTIVIETIRRCNLRCEVCPTVYAIDYPKGVMPIKDFKRILKNLNNTPITRIGLTGWGEPLLDPYLKERIELLKSLNFTTGLTTNAVFLNKEIFNFLCENIDYLAISLDTYHLKSSHNYHLIKKILNLLKKGSSPNFLSINIVISKTSINLAEEIIEKFYKLVNCISIIPITIIPSKHLLTHLTSKEELVALKEKFKEKTSNISFSYLDPPPQNNCRSDILKNAYITVEGEVCPCCVLAMTFPIYSFNGKRGTTKVLSFGNLKHSPFPQIFFSSKYVRFRNQFKKGKIPKTCLHCNAWKTLP